MSSKYLYLLINICAVAIPFAFSFYPKAKFASKWQHLWPALLLPAIFFIIWDDWFTRMGVWGFNPAYVTGVRVFSLPVEEILFFICIPYACVFTYEAVNYFLKRRVLIEQANWLNLFLFIGCFAMAIIFRHKWYTFSAFFVDGLILAYLYLKVKPDYLGNFFLSLLIISVPFSVVNGILTGTGIDAEVVWYNNAENLRIRLATIPVEDIFYGMALLLLNVSIFEGVQKKNQANK